MSERGRRTEEVCEQLRRYGGEVYDDDLLDALEAIVEINDDLCHYRSRRLIEAGVEKAVVALRKLIQ